jgi:hypothetical protein
MSEQRTFSPFASRRGRAGLATLAACLGAAIAAPLVIGSGEEGPGSASSADDSSGSPAARVRCPSDARRLPANGVPAAAEAALAQASDLYGSEKNLQDMRVIQATWAPRAAARGRYARVKCGRRVQKRTVVVELEFPKEPGASLKQGIVLVSRIPSGYDAWAVLH